MVGNPAVPAIEDRNTKCPRPRASIPGRTCRVSTIGASRFSRVAARTTAGSITAAMSVVSIPALFTSTSIGPWSVSTTGTRASTAPASVRSTTTASPPTSAATA